MSGAEQPPAVEEEKRPFQFSLRAMFALTFIWALFFAVKAMFGFGWAVIDTVIAGWLAGLVYIFFRQWFKLTIGAIALVFIIACVWRYVKPPLESWYPQTRSTELRETFEFS